MGGNVSCGPRRRSRRRVPEPEAARAGARWSEGPRRGGAAERAARRPLSERPTAAAQPEGGLASARLAAAPALGARAAFPLGPRAGDGPGLHGLARAPPLSPGPETEPEPVRAAVAPGLGRARGVGRPCGLQAFRAGRSSAAGFGGPGGRGPGQP